MRLGINLPTSHADGTPFTAAELMTRARKIEEAGFDGIWVSDTVYRNQMIYPDPLQWLLVAALATKQVELGTAVLQVPLREPFELAKRLVTLNVLTAGRFSLGAGAGSTRIDFEALGVSYEDRFRLLTRDLSILRRICAGEQVGSASMAPWATPGGGLRLLIGSWSSSRWVTIAAREYDGWMTSGMHAKGLADLKEGIERYREAGGRRAMIATAHIDLEAPRRPLTDDGPFNLICGAEEAAERLQHVAELGYDDVLLTKWTNQTEDDLPAFRALLPRA